MFNVLVYKIFKRGDVPIVTLFINFNGCSSVETALRKEYFRQGVYIDLIGVFSFDIFNIFDCMISFAKEMEMTYETARNCNKRLILCLKALKKKERKRHCLGFVQWKEFLCQHYRKIYPMNPFGSSDVKFRAVVKSLKTL